MIRNLVRWSSGVVAVVMLGAIGYGLTGSATADDRAAGQGPQIVRVEKNVHGVDTAANAYLESISVQNLSGGAVDMTGWTLRDATGHRFRFPSGYTMAANATVRVRTGKVPGGASAWWTNPVFNLYWNLSYHQYGNTSDSVSLRNAAGTEVDYTAWNPFTVLP